MRILKRLCRAALHRAGYELYRRPFLPKGVDPLESLRALWPTWQPRVVFDVGANIGQTVARVHALFPRAVIHAFEPVPATHAELVRNTSAIPGVHAHALALGDHEGEVTLRLQSHSTLNSLAPALNVEAPAGAAVSVRVTTIEKFSAAQGIADISLLKIDTEGFELPVLRGAAPLLSRGAVDYVLAEAGLMPNEPRFTPLGALTDFLHPYGYWLVGIYEQQGWRHQRSAEFCNALFALERNLQT